jgi:uncharacterized protein (TIGR02270 family)
MAPDPVIDNILSQHAEETGFLWALRGVVVHSPRVSLVELARHDERIAAHIDGLRVAEDAGWKSCEAAIAEGASGAAFGAMVLALEERNLQRIEALLMLAQAAPALREALISAFGWISANFLQGTAKQLLSDSVPFRRRVGIACCVMHCVDPRAALDAAISDADPDLKADALGAVGHLGRGDLRPLCERQLTGPDSVGRFDAAWSAVMLGNQGVALAVLTRFGLESGANKARAFRLMLQAMTLGASHEVLQGLGGDPQQLRWLILGSGIAGDPKYIAWLIKHTHEDTTARLAGESFSLITGVDLSALNLGRAQPEGFEGGPNDEPDDPDVEMDLDDGLPWPDSTKVEKWWAANSGRFAPGTRYFMGAPVTREHCIDVLKNGYQRQRILAAQYLCLLDPGTPLFNTSAPAWRQQRLLAKMG